MIGIGAKVNFVPFAFNDGIRGIDPTTKKPFPTSVSGRVVWIHPKRRFYLVEYCCNGHTLRECFQM